MGGLACWMEVLLTNLLLLPLSGMSLSAKGVDEKSAGRRFSSMIWGERGGDVGLSNNDRKRAAK